MKLTELNPRWIVLEQKGSWVGLTFDCPHCKTQRLAVMFHESGHEVEQDAYILANHGAADVNHIWTRKGRGFEDLTIFPSIDASASGHWHGFITDGDVK